MIKSFNKSIIIRKYIDNKAANSIIKKINTSEEKMLQIGQISDVRITDVNHMGKGVGKINDFVVFIDNTSYALTCIAE